MDVDNVWNNPDPESGEASPPCKLDLRYFTEPHLGPFMVRRKARRSFELFLYLAHRFFRAFGEPVSPEHEELCAACGLDPNNPHTRPMISRLLRSLRVTYQVIDYQPIRRKRPQIRLRPARMGTDVLNPKHYVYFRKGWDRRNLATFAAAGRRAFAAEYMYLIAQYEATLAEQKFGRPYWFFPLEKIAEQYHVSTRFASVGLQALVQLGVLRIAPGQYGIRASNDEFGRANRYYWQGLGEVARRRIEFDRLRLQYEKEFETAVALSVELINGRTTKNVEGLCELLAAHGKRSVREAVARLASQPRRSMRRRVAYVRAVLSGVDKKRPPRTVGRDDR